MIRIAIVEDDDQQARLLRDYSTHYGAEHQLEFATERFNNGLLFLEAYCGNYDLVLMDIAMPVMNGMECAKKLRERDEQIQIVFITSMAQYAINGYQVEATAYMVKPVKYTEYALTMERIIRRLRSRQSVLYTIGQKSDMKVVDITDIFYVEVLSHYLIFHTRNGNYKTYGKLSSVEADNRFQHFIKVSPSYLVSCKHITNIGKDTVTVCGDQIPLSRRRRNECLTKMARMMGGGLT